MLWIFKKKLPELKYLSQKWQTSESIAGIIQLIAKWLEPSHKTPCNYLYSDYWIFETGILIFQILRILDMKTWSEIRDALFEYFIRISADIFNKDTTYISSLVNQRWELYFPLLKDGGNNLQLAYNILVWYAKSWVIRHMLDDRDWTSMILDMWQQIIYTPILDSVIDNIVEAILKTIDAWTREQKKTKE